jgi:hypothetical protein
MSLHCFCRVLVCGSSREGIDLLAASAASFFERQKQWRAYAGRWTTFAQREEKFNLRVTRYLWKV